MIILLPPSEGKAGGGRGRPWDPSSGRFGAALGATRRELAALLAAREGGDELLLGVGGQHLERARAANRALLNGPPAIPASSRYTGVVHDHIGLATLSPAIRRKARQSIIIVSGLLGLVALDDPVPDYRLKMGARLDPLGLLSRHWRPILSDALADHLAGESVIDLLPGEHRAAWTPGPGTIAHRVSLVERSGGALGGHDAKAAKGRLVRHLLTSRAGPLRALKTFEDERYAALLDHDVAVSARKA